MIETVETNETMPSIVTLVARTSMVLAEEIKRRGMSRLTATKILRSAFDVSLGDAILFIDSAIGDLNEGIAK